MTREDISWRDSIEKKPLVYHYDRSLVEAMTIRAGWRGVEMRGGGNVIRNSTIEVDGHTAIVLMGPETVIENNTIIVHGKGDAKPFDAAIKLRDAKGAIVRNNRIVYKGLWPFGKAPAAINLLDSTDVTIEGNTVERFEKLVRSNGETQFVDNGNVFK